MFFLRKSAGFLMESRRAGAPGGDQGGPPQLSNFDLSMLFIWGLGPIRASRWKAAAQAPPAATKGDLRSMPLADWTAVFGRGDDAAGKTLIDLKFLHSSSSSLSSY